MTRNIVINFGRFHYKDNSRFVRKARGSAFECLNDLDSFVLENFNKAKEIEEGIKPIQKAIFSMNGFIKYQNQIINNQ